MKLVIKKQNPIMIGLYCIIAVVVRILYIWLAKEILYQFSYGPSHPNYDICYNQIKDVVAASAFLIETILLLILKRDTRFKEDLLYLFYILYFLPLNAITPLVNASYSFLILSNLFILEFVFVLSINRGKRQIESLERCAKVEELLNDRRIHLFCIIICVAFVIYKLSINGLEFTLSLSDSIYENRMSTIEMIRETSTSLMGRITNLIANLATYIAPIYLLISIKQKKPIGIIIAFITLLSQFSVYSMKTTILLIPVVFAICLYKRKTEWKWLLLLGFLFIYIVLGVAWARAGKSLIYYLIVRRACFIPTWLNTMYFDFFSKNTKLLLTDEVFLLRHILPPVYEQRVLELISNSYFDGLMASPNNGMFAEGFMQFGTVGILVYPILYRLIFDWIEGTYKCFSDHFQLLIICIIVMNLPNVGILRSDFVMSFLLLTYVIKLLLRVRIKS